MNEKAKRLTLSKETIVDLTTADKGDAGGKRTIITICSICTGSEC